MKALIGSWDVPPYRLLAELTALRSRVAQLEQELRRVREENELLQASLSSTDDIEVALSAS